MQRLALHLGSRPRPPSPREVAGLAVGWALAPLVALGTELRHSRLFHPRGECYAGEAFALSVETPGFTVLARRLAGPVIARFSSAWWKGDRERHDVLGCALRFTDVNGMSGEPWPGDQDLLLATIRLPITTPFAPITTRQHDFQGNRYHGVSPFWSPEAGRIKVRLVPIGRRTIAGDDRWKKLDRSIAAHRAQFHLEARPLGRRSHFEPILRIELLDKLEIDQEALTFWPFRAGRGLHPWGFVQALRYGAYRTGQTVRT